MDLLRLIELQGVALVHTSSVDRHLCAEAIRTIHIHSMDPCLTAVLEQEAQDSWQRLLEGD